MNRDAIDFGRTNVSALFARIFVPTLLGLLFTAIVTLADGIFVGRGVGSDALAAINITAPLFTIAMGIALMFGSGVSIVAAIHLSRGSPKAACINATQAIVVATALMLLVAAAVYAFPRQVAALFGGTERLYPYVREYLFFVMPALLFSVVAVVGMFVIRLDGSPNYAMMANVVGSLLNIGLDWFFVFPLGMGLKGAAIATSLSLLVSATMVIYYMMRRAAVVKFYRLKTSAKSLRLTVRNVGYMAKLGFSTFLGECATSCMMIAGNFMFVSRMGEDGVAAFSVACYTFPLVFIFGNAVAQSALPIISYNHGIGRRDRVARTFRLSLSLALVCSLVLTLCSVRFCPLLIGCFLRHSEPAYLIAVSGFPLFSLSFVSFTLNLVLIGYCQARKEARLATVFMSLRGYIFVAPIFVVLPSLVGDKGLWLAVPVSELLTLIVIIVRFVRARAAGAD